eukprot:3536828-Pyramimonas_sp.AAC.1
MAGWLVAGCANSRTCASSAGARSWRRRRPRETVLHEAPGPSGASIPPAERTAGPAGPRAGGPEIVGFYFGQTR